MYRSKRQSAQINTDDIYVINLLAIELLEELGIIEPHQQQIDAMESFLKFIIQKGQYVFSENLNRHESECLYWLAKGRTPEDIANILEINLKTVEFYLKSLCKKLNCQTLPQAVFEGMKFAYLCPKPTEPHDNK